MKRILSALLITLSILLIQSCKKDAPAVVKDKPPVNGDKDVDDKPDPNAIYLVKTISLANHYYTTQYALSYDDKNRLVEYKYKDSLQIKWDTRYEYTYDNADRMVKREYYNINDKLVNTVDYQYTSADDPKKGLSL